MQINMHQLKTEGVFPNYSRISNIQATQSMRRPGQFGLFIPSIPNEQICRIIEEGLPHVGNLDLMRVEWVNLGLVKAVLFSSNKPQQWMSTWMLIFKYMFQNTLGQDLLLQNSRRVVRIIADTRQSDAMAIHVLRVSPAFFWQMVWEFQLTLVNRRSPTNRKSPRPRLPGCTCSRPPLCSQPCTR